MAARSSIDLVAEARDGSHVAFAALVDRYHASVSRVIASRLGRGRPDGEDIMQQTFAAAWFELPQLRTPEKFGAWLNGIAQNLARRWIRNETRYREILVAQGRPEHVLRDERRGANASWATLSEHLAELPGDQREAVTLHYRHGMSYAEIGSELSVPVSTVLGRLQRARRRLREEHGPMAAQLRLDITPDLRAFLQEHAVSRGVGVEELATHVLTKYRDGVEGSLAKARREEEKAKVSPPTEMNAEEAREAVRRFFQALVDGDYAAANAMTETGYRDTRWEETSYASVTEIVEIGEPYQEEGRQYAGGQGVFVPYELRAADSPRKPWRVAMRRDNPDGRWVFDGGL